MASHIASAFRSAPMSSTNDLCPAQIVAAAHLVQDPFRHAGDAGRAALLGVMHDRESAGAEMDDEIARRRRLTQPRGELPQQLVAALRAEGRIEQAELEQIDEQHRDAARRPRLA